MCKIGILDLDIANTAGHEVKGNSSGQRLVILSGPRRGKAGAIESHIAWKWHIITLQEAIDYLDHDFLTNRSM